MLHRNISVFSRTENCPRELSECQLNEDKCKVVSYGRNILINANYNLKQSVLAREDSYNDLGVKFDTKLKFDCHRNEKVNKAYML